MTKFSFNIPLLEKESSALKSIPFSIKIIHIETTAEWLHSAIKCKAVFLLCVKSLTLTPAKS